MATPLHHTWTYQAVVHDVLVIIFYYCTLISLNRRCYDCTIGTFKDLESNRVRVNVSTDPSREQMKEFYVNDHDKFWATHKGRYETFFKQRLQYIFKGIDDIILNLLTEIVFSPFPAVAEAVQEELDSYRCSEDEIKRLKHAMVWYCLIWLAPYV